MRNNAAVDTVIDAEVLMVAFAACGPQWSFQHGKNSHLIFIQCKNCGPDLDHTTVKHLGLHPNYFVPYINKGFVLSVIRALVPALKSALQAGKTHIRIVFMDYWGFHESVAACKAIAHCVKCDKNLSLSRTLLWNRQSDAVRGGLFSDEFWPDEETQPVQEALETVRKHWMVHKI